MNKKRKRAAEEEGLGDLDVSVEDVPPSDNPQQSGVTTNLPPLNLSVGTLTKIYTEFSSPVKVQQRLLEGSITTFSISIAY